MGLTPDSGKERNVILSDSDTYMEYSQFYQRFSRADLDYYISPSLVSEQARHLNFRSHITHIELSV